MAGEVTALSTQPDEGQIPSPHLPASSTEAINLMVHYYRGELGRMAGWRDRIDRTTNWAITVVAAMLSISLSTPSSHHGVLLFAMLLISLLLLIEARRYRFFDVYRARVRQIEKKYFAEFLEPRGDLSTDWAAAIAKSLRKPEFLIGYREAACRRLRRNYSWMYLILLLAWALKISSSTMTEAGPFDVALSVHQVLKNAALGPIPGGAVLVIVAAFYFLVVAAVLHEEPSEGERVRGEAHV
ncbi:DUF2270 domain-containing protein [Rhizobium sp. ARZ01]|uniref:DUF2270 domain-containing protein n=1 Tax=Rhizobium sp. ARZ01 TaxID=2769313 RepID=UPI00177CF601|nr:DUF2270 domain-containing protein [Rhizobium sp. ARZ01]MBD9372209.1 DUF2270 domain-containing protein [Rhizobium sp. ARZ01]